MERRRVVYPTSTFTYEATVSLFDYISYTLEQLGKEMTCEVRLKFNLLQEMFSDLQTTRNGSWLLCRASIELVANVKYVWTFSPQHIRRYRSLVSRIGNDLCRYRFLNSFHVLPLSLSSANVHSELFGKISNHILYTSI